MNVLETRKGNFCNFVTSIVNNKKLKDGIKLNVYQWDSIWEGEKNTDLYQL